MRISADRSADDIVLKAEEAAFEMQNFPSTANFLILLQHSSDFRHLAAPVSFSRIAAQVINLSLKRRLYGYANPE